MKLHSLILLMAAAAAPSAEAVGRAPVVLVDQGACPFECCQYGQWMATTAVPAFESPGAHVRQATIIAPGTAVTAITGYVRTVGKKFLVTRPHAPYKRGDVLRVYTYQGEGMFTVWHDGRTFTEDLGFSPYGGTGGTRCTDAAYCWGTLAHELQSQWWIQLRLPDGRVVWILESDGFQGQDACG